METARPVICPARLKTVLDDLARQGLALDLIAATEDGLTNHNLILANDSERYMLRLDCELPGQLGIDRQLEQQVLAALVGKLFPPIAAKSNTMGYLLTGYVDATKRTLDADSITPMIEAMKSYHCLIVDAAPINYLERIELLTPPSRLSLWLNVKALFERALIRVESMFGYHPGLCHHDLITDNILWQSGRRLPWIIDWEYAAPGDIFFDLASLVDAQALSLACERRLLQEYFGRADMLYKLRVYRAIYRMLCLAWYWRQNRDVSMDISAIELMLSP